MRKPLWRDGLFALAVLAFFCLLLGGGSRLIASPDAQPGAMLPPPNVVKASLTCPPCAQAQVLHAEKAQVIRPFAAAAVFREEGGAAFSLPQTDSNGNVLTQASYMRAVYQVFALGDGFA